MKISLRSAGIWISEAQVLLESLADHETWSIPGGGVKPGEPVKQACIREYLEETGLSIGCERLALIHENFWDDAGIAIQEYCFYFIIHPTVESIPRPIISSLEGHLLFRWHALNELDGISFVPQVIKGCLASLPNDTVYISSRNDL